MADTLQTNDGTTSPNPKIGDLTFREWEVLLLIAEDKTNIEIAALSNMKPDSIRTMRNRIGDKLALKGHHKLGHFARKNREALHHIFPLLHPPRTIHDKKPDNRK